MGCHKAFWVVVYSVFYMILHSRVGFIGLYRV